MNAVGADRDKVASFAAGSTRTLGVMKYCIILLTFVAQQCMACELLSIHPVRKDVEAMFAGQAIAGYAEKYGTSGPVERTDENEYKEDSPTETRRFNSVQRTLHHGVYLVGFDAEQMGGCFRLVRVTIHRG